MNPNQRPGTATARLIGKVFEEPGRREGKREALLNILAARGLTPSAEEGERIAACTDADLLGEWIMRACDNGSIDLGCAGPGRAMSSKRFPETRAARRFREFFEERGRREGKLEVLLDIFDARGLTPSAEDCERIMACTDADLLDEWIVRATTAASVAEVLSPYTR